MTNSNEHGLQSWCGAALRVRRQAAGWTLLQLASQIKTTTSSLHRWESEIHPPNSETIAQLATIFDSQPEDFSREPRVV